jgi:CheY-like chemotaxis protein
MMNRPTAQTPHWQLAAAPPPDRDRPGDEAGEAEAPSRALRVLIVEDEFFIALDHSDQVEALGHVVVGTAVSAEEAVALAERERPDVVLMDIRLSGPRDGIDAADEILGRFGIRSIFVTANTDPRTRHRAQAIGSIAFLEKPLTEQHLKDCLRRLKGG